MLILPQRRNPVDFSGSRFAPSRDTAGAVFVLFMIAVLASYVCLSLQSRLDTTVSIFTAFIVAGLFLLYRARPACIPDSRVRYRTKLDLFSLFLLL